MRRSPSSAAPGRATSATGARFMLTPAARSVRAAARPSARACPASRTSAAARCRRAGDAAHRPALLVGHDDQRRAQAARALDRLQPAHDRAHLRGRAHVAREQDHAGRLAAGDPRAQRRRRRQPVVGEDHVLADELAQRRLRRRGARRRRAGAQRLGRPLGGLRSARAEREDRRQQLAYHRLTPRAYVLHHRGCARPSASCSSSPRSLRHPHRRRRQPRRARPRRRGAA